jgi:hypothetical protein
MFPSLFRDSSDHHESLRKTGDVNNPLFPSLFRDSSDHHIVEIMGQEATLKLGFHPSLGIPLIITWLRATRWGGGFSCFHPSLEIPLIIIGAKPK